MHTTENQDSKELTARIDQALAEKQHRFELHDPFAETTHRFQTAKEATTTAAELGASRMQYIDENGKVEQVNRVDGNWKFDNGKSLDAVQKQIDEDSLLGIEARAEQRSLIKQGIDPETDRKMATVDAHAFQRIQDPGRQEDAAITMAGNAHAYSDYKAGLDTAIPGRPGTAEKVYALDAANNDKIMQKETGKSHEYAEMRAEREERARSWTPEEAAKRAQEDSKAIQAEADKAERIYMENDAISNAKANPHYKSALEKHAPEIAETLQKDQRPLEEIRLNPADLSRVAAARAHDSAQAREALGINSVEPNIEKQQQQLPEDQDAKRAAWLNKGESKPEQNQSGNKAPGVNQVESDEIFTARQSEIKPTVPADIEKQYLRVGDKFYHPKNTDLVAFEDKGNRLETRANSEAIAESMVRIAEARGWDEIKVSGSETFRKEVWLEAASRGMHVKGYNPSEQDKAELEKRSRDSEANKVEKDNKPIRAREKDADEEKGKPANIPEVDKQDRTNKRRAEAFAKETPVEAVKKHPELAGAVAAVAAMDMKAEAEGLTPAQRAVVSARVRQNVVNSIERGDLPEVKVKETIELRRDAKEEKEYTR
jgi:hypothetical protein